MGLCCGWLVRRWRPGILPAALDPVAVAVHFQDMDMVGEPVQQRLGEPLGAEHVGPFVKGEVGGD